MDSIIFCSDAITLETNMNSSVVMYVCMYLYTNDNHRYMCMYLLYMCMCMFVCMNILTKSC